jgi:hypothetical protein
MALYITDEMSKKRYIWHFSEPLPIIPGGVVTFQADGDELNLLLGAIRSTIPSQEPSSGNHVVCDIVVGDVNL